MAMCRDLNSDDVKDLHVNSNSFNVLAAVAGRARLIFEAHVACTGKRKLQEEKKQEDVVAVKREKRFYGSHDGEASTSTAPVKKKNSIIIKLKLQQPSPPQSPPLPEELNRMIGEMARGKSLTAPPTLVIQKGLTGTDVNKHHNRFAIPINQIRDDFLTDEEKRFVNARDEATQKKKFMEVKIIDPLHVIDKAKFTRWDMLKKNGRGKPSSIYNIIGSWFPIVKRNNLTKEMEVQLWCFRVEQDLCFALVRVPPRNATSDQISPLTVKRLSLVTFVSQKL